MCVVVRSRTILSIKKVNGNFENTFNMDTFDSLSVKDKYEILQYLSNVFKNAMTITQRNDDDIKRMLEIRK